MTLIAHARSLAEATPETRNRYVDFLRAISILAVVVGHWMIAAPVVTDGEIRGVNLLAHAPWTHWLTWVFQVMPVFFMVGGFSNAVSWRSAERYGPWLMARLRRLVVPASVLVVFWAGMGIALTSFGVDESLIRLGSQSAVIPVWFLAVYVVVVAATPLMANAWDRWGWATIVAMASGALVVDVIASDGSWLAFVNFGFVWFGVGLVGIAWQRGKMTTPISLAMAVVASALLTYLLATNRYPISMVGVPGAVETNNSPPTLALLLFGLVQVSLLLAVEPFAKRALESVRLWTGTVLVNGLIMTLYLWHLTAMVMLIGTSLLTGGVGLGTEPGSALWWMTRPIWIAVLAVVTMPFIVAFRRFDALRRVDSTRSSASALTAAALACIGLGMLAGGGIGGSFFGVNGVAVAMVLGAVGIVHTAGTPPPEGRSA